MTHTGITWRFTVNVRGAASGQVEQLLEQHLDQLMEEMLTLESSNPKIHDPSIGGSLAEGDVEIELYVDCPMDEAVEVSRSFVRTAIHAAGGFTPSWDEGAAEPALAVEYEPEAAELIPA